MINPYESPPDFRATSNVVRVEHPSFVWKQGDFAYRFQVERIPDAQQIAQLFYENRKGSLTERLANKVTLFRKGSLLQRIFLGRETGYKHHISVTVTNNKMQTEVECRYTLYTIADWFTGRDYFQLEVEELSKEMEQYSRAT